jgi:pentapeptide MXKDX repeat protein
MVRRHAAKEVIRMRKLIIATTALAFLSSTGMAAFAQDKSTAAPAASGDSMSKGDMSKDKMSKSKKSKKSKKSDDMSK